jgi:hypothetical protein
MLRYIGDTPFANRTWQLHASGPTNWYLARFEVPQQRPAFCIYGWSGSGQRWNIPAGMLDISPAQLPMLLRRLTPVPADSPTLADANGPDNNPASG